MYVYVYTYTYLEIRYGYDGLIQAIYKNVMSILFRSLSLSL